MSDNQIQEVKQTLYKINGKTYTVRASAEKELLRMKKFEKIDNLNAECLGIAQNIMATLSQTGYWTGYGGEEGFDIEKNGLRNAASLKLSLDVATEQLNELFAMALKYINNKEESRE